jgi:DegV family protein with EDD domain
MSGAPQVAVVTDSTAYLPVAVIDRYGLTVVPLQVVLDGRVGTEGAQVTPADVAAALDHRRAKVSTSRPPPMAFLAAYDDAAKATGVTDIVSVHLSGELSGTVASARLAAAEVAPRLRVRVVDSRSTAMGLGFAVMAAAAAAATGAGLAAVEQAAVEQAARTSSLFYVATLEHLRRGGRLGAAAALVGSALAVKPILHVVDGRIAPLAKVRTASKALARLEELAVEAAGDGPVELAVHHLAAPQKAGQLADRLRYRIAGATEVYVSEVGAVVGAHVGPGLLGVVIARR